MAGVVIGIDVGTGSTKAVAVMADGRVLARARAVHPTRVSEGEAEQDPLDWLAGCGRVGAHLVSAGTFAPGDVEAISFSGQIRTLVLARASGEPVAPAMLWYDARWDDTAEGVRRSLPGAPAITLGPLSVVSKLRWVRRHRPEVHGAADWVLSPKDFVKWRLCGAVAGDPSDASGYGLLDVPARRWSDTLVSALEVDPSTLPPLIESTAAAGALTREGARVLGLREGTPVIQGGSDNACGALGAGVIDGGRALAGLGTSGVLLAALAAPRDTRPAELWCHAAPDRWYAWGILLTGGRALDWAFGTLFGAPLSGPEGVTLLREALALPARADGPLFLPYLAEETTGAFSGLRATHTRADVARAVLDGVALGLRELLERVRAGGVEVTSAVAAGPVAGEPAWLELLAGALGVPVARPLVEDAAELGAATLAAAGCGLAASVQDAVAAMVRVGPGVFPGARETDAYDRLAARFAEARA